MCILEIYHKVFLLPYVEVFGSHTRDDDINLEQYITPKSVATTHAKPTKIFHLPRETIALWAMLKSCLSYLSTRVINASCKSKIRYEEFLRLQFSPPYPCRWVFFKKKDFKCDYIRSFNCWMSQKIESTFSRRYQTKWRVWQQFGRNTAHCVTRMI